MIDKIRCIRNIYSLYYLRKFAFSAFKTNFFNKKVCHCIDDRHGYFSFLTHHKGKNT